MGKQKWTKESLRLKDNHAWSAPEGYRIFVADRGALRINFPDGWVVKPDEDSIKLYDREPPDDNCRLALSYLRLPPVDLSGLPVDSMIQIALDSETRVVLDTAPIVHRDRPGLDIAWTDITFLDPYERRRAFSRICIARGSGIQALITFDFWPEDAARLTPVWDEVVRSLTLGRTIKDPTMGR